MRSRDSFKRWRGRAWCTIARCAAAATYALAAARTVPDSRCCNMDGRNAGRSARRGVPTSATLVHARCQAYVRVFISYGVPPLPDYTNGALTLRLPSSFRRKRRGIVYLLSSKCQNPAMCSGGGLPLPPPTPPTSRAILFAVPGRHADNNLSPLGVDCSIVSHIT